MRKKLNLFYIIILIISLYYIYYAIKKIFLNDNMIFELSYIYILLLVIYFSAHVFRVIRFYVLFAEHNVRFRTLVIEYFPTALISFIFPFKLGEFVRVYRFSIVSKNMMSGIMSIWLERVFDSMIIFFFLLMALFFNQLQSYTLIITLSVFLFGSLFLYFAISFSHFYLNNYFLTQRASKSSLTILKCIQIVVIIKESARILIAQRLFVLVFLSLLIWLLEFLELLILVRMLGSNGLSWLSLTQWIDSMYSNVTDLYGIVGIYYFIGLAVLLMMSIPVLIYQLIKYIKANK